MTSTVHRLSTKAKKRQQDQGRTASYASYRAQAPLRRTRYHIATPPYVQLDHPLVSIKGDAQGLRKEREGGGANTGSKSNGDGLTQTSSSTPQR
jgi:hypothetical protein